MICTTGFVLKPKAEKLYSMCAIYRSCSEVADVSNGAMERCVHMVVRVLINLLYGWITRILTYKNLDCV